MIFILNYEEYITSDNRIIMFIILMGKYLKFKYFILLLTTAIDTMVA